MSEKPCQTALCRKIMSGAMAVIFFAGSLMPVSAQSQAGLSPVFAPPLVRGMTIDPKDPFAFKFLMDRGDGALPLPQRTAVYEKLIKYFLASLAVPEDDVWVNLSPYESNRIVADNLGMTVMGRDLLEADYTLKQVTASLFNPDQEPGKSFWKKVRQAAYERYGTTDVPLDTFNKVWIVPGEAKVYEEGNSVILVKSRLKVMLEQDYLAQKKNASARAEGPRDEATALSRAIVREVMLPVLEKEVNEGAGFAVLRQITASLILATWYKKAWRDRLLNQVYTDRSKVKGVDQDPVHNQEVFNRYVEAFKAGAVNMIREEYDALSQETIPRKYFSGGYSTKLAGDDAQATTLADRLKRVLRLPAGILDPDRQDVVTAAFARAGAQRHGVGLLSSGVIMSMLFLGSFIMPVSSAQALTPVNAQFLAADAGSAGRPAVNWTAEGDQRLNRIVAAYVKQQGGAVRLNPMEFPRLEPVLRGVNFKGAAPFQALSAALKAEFKRAAASGQSTFELSQEAVLFFQRVVRAQGYNRYAKSMSDVLNGQGYNCVAISELSVLAYQEWGGSDSLGLVRVIKGDDGKSYPDKNGIGHECNVLRQGARMVILDQGGVAKHPVLEVVIDGKEVAVPTAQLSGRPWKAKGTADLVEDFKYKISLSDLFRRNNTMQGASPEKYKAILVATQELARSPVARWQENEVNRVNLLNILQKNLNSTVTVQTANQLVAEYNKKLDDFDRRLVLAGQTFNSQNWKQASQEYTLIAEDVVKAKAVWKKTFESSPLAGKAGETLALLDQRMSSAQKNAAASQYNASITTARPSGGPVSAQTSGTRADEVFNAQKRIMDDYNTNITEISRMMQQDPQGGLKALDALERRILSGKAAQMPEYEKLLANKSLILTLNGKPATLAGYRSIFDRSLAEIARFRGVLKYNLYGQQINGFARRFNVEQRDGRAMRALVQDIQVFLEAPGPSKEQKTKAREIQGLAASRADHAENMAPTKDLGGIDLSANAFDLDITGHKGSDEAVPASLVDIAGLEGLAPRILAVTSAAEYLKLFTSR